MESIGAVSSNVLEFNPNTLQEVRKLYNLDQPGRMDEAINILDEWIQKQGHFMKKDFKTSSHNKRLTMESIGEVPSKVLEFHSNTLQEVRKLYNLDQPGSMDEAINLLEEWIRKQDHFMKKDFSRFFLEKMIIVNKGQLERVKRNFDTICTKRTLTSQYFVVDNVKHYKELHFLNDFPLPKLTPGNRRIYFICYKSDPDKRPIAPIWKMFYRKCIIAWEFVQRFDYCDGYILIIDARRFNCIEVLTSMSLTELSEMIDIYQKGYGARMKAIHLITTSTWINKIVGIMKQLMGPKLASRIYAHQTLDTVYDHVPKDILPEEYGGKEKSVQELNEAWLDQLSSEDNLKYLKMLQDIKTDESRRSVVQFNEQYLGTPGTFRNLVVD